MTEQQASAATPASTDAAIEVADVSRWYGNVVAVNNVSFDHARHHRPARTERRR
jgi:hypothetical protein